MGRIATCWRAIGLAALVSSACAPDFDTSRGAPPRGTLGHELFSLVCDRVGAQALREDVTGASFHAVCHADARGAFADEVDASQLPPLDPGAVDEAGRPVSLADQRSHRAHRIARIEALARRREDFARALDGAIPASETIGRKDLGAADPAKSCAAPGAGQPGEAPLGKELAATLGRLVDLYDDRTIPHFTEGIGDVMGGVSASPDAQAALARLDARVGYRPLAVAGGVARPALSYPRLAELADALLAVLASGGRASDPMQRLFAVLHEELRTVSADAPLAPLALAADPVDPTRRVLSRPRSDLELLRAVFLAQDPAFTAGEPSLLVVRDARGVADVARQNGKIPPPFVDADGDGLADVDALGRFVTAGGAQVPSPFFAPGAPDAPRDALGRVPLYTYADARQTTLAWLLRDLAPLVDPEPAHAHEALMGLAGGLPVVAGTRDAAPTTTRAYPPDAPLAYRAFHPDDSPLVDLVYAAGQLLASDTTDDTLALLRALAVDHPRELARLVGVGLRLKQIADHHPEAHIPAQSTLWDELLDVFVQIAETPGVLEDLVRAFGKDETLALKDVFAAYAAFRDELTYDKTNLNGPAFDVTTNSVSPLVTPVDRTQPDVGANRSALQRFMALLHDANGLAACTKDGAVAHVQWNGVAMDYPTDPLAKVACAALLSPLPSKLPQCGILRIENVAALLLDVALGRAKFDIRDPCLAKLVNSPLTGIVGGADAFLEQISGIKGFSTHPTVNGVARLVYYDTPHDGLPGDASNPQTMRFIEDVIDPVPSMACPVAPFTDADGTVVPLRKCASFGDTLRGRDDDALFPLEELDFMKNVQPLAAAFADHGAPLLFVQLFDTLHRHWGTQVETKDGAVTYEPLLVDALHSDLFDALHAVVPVLAQIQIAHCTKQDPVTHACVASAPRDGVTVLAEAVRAALDPKRNEGLTDRAGNRSARRNDGTTNPQTTPVYLLAGALDAIDARFAADGVLHPDSTRLAKWRGARSQLVDTFFSVDGDGAASAFADPAVVRALPAVIDALREQLTAHCPDARLGAGCPWASQELAQKLADSIGGPTFAASVDLLDAVRADDAARAELERLAQYLITAGDARAGAATATAAVDALQWLGDDADLAPLLRAISPAFAPATTDSAGNVTRRSLGDASIELLARVLAKQRGPDGAEICAREIDPERTFPAVLRNLVTPLGDADESPLALLAGTVADVNRAHPEDTAKLDAGDYGAIASEVEDFCDDPSRGLEQVYEVIREATRP